MLRLSALPRLKVLTLMLLVFLVSFCTPVGAVDTKPYTILIYLNGSDLESDPEDGGAASGNFEEMMQVGTTGNLNIVVETGGTKKWQNPAISHSQNQRWLVEKNNLHLLQSLGKQDMGQPATLRNFITWAVTNYPAEKYFLILWDHGAGPVSGFASDELFSNSSLSLPDIHTALAEAQNQTGARFEVIGFDACLMAGIETAAAVAPFANYLVASEETIPSHGWEYTSILKAIDISPQITGDSLGRIIADSYRKSAARQETNTNITLSVIDLAKIQPVVNSLNALVDRIGPELDSPGFTALAQARSKAESYGDNGSGPKSNASDLADLHHLVSLLQNKYPEAAGVADSIDQAVLYRIAGSGKPHAKGLSVYFPYKDKENAADNVAEYQKTGFCPGYVSLLGSYVNHLNGNNKSTLTVKNLRPQSAETETEAKTEQPEAAVAADQTANVDRVYSLLVLLDESSAENHVVLRTDRNLSFDESTGEVNDRFNRNWAAIDGHFVSLFLEEQTDGYDIVSIPAQINGSNRQILAICYPDGTGKVIGSTKGNTAAGMPDRTLRPIQPGDRIALIYETRNSTTSAQGTLLSQPFLAGKDLTLSLRPLPSGNYLYAYQVDDIYQNSQYTDFVPIIVK